MIFVIFLTVFLAALIARQYQKAKRLPPGPTSLPLIGNIHQLAYVAWREKGIVPAFEYFRKQYGDVFTLWLGPLPHVSICDYETSQEVFVKNGNKYKDRFLPPIFEHISEGLGLVTANGEVWAEMRRFTLLAFRSMGVRTELMEDRIMDELNARCKEIDADAVDGKTVVHTSHFFDLTVGSIINSLLVGKRFDEHNKGEFLELKGLMDAAADVFGVMDLTVPVWVLQKFFPDRYERSRCVQQSVTDFVSREALQRAEDVKAGKHTLNYEVPSDFVDAFLVKMEKEEKNGGHPAYTLDCLKHTLSDLWFAGQDTTTTTLVSGFNLLVNHPEKLRKLREELLRITNNGARSLSLQDRTETHYLNATIMEIQRHASILNVNFWRLVNEPTVVNGYPVDSGALMTAQLGALHVNGDIFKNPQDFYPERFIEDERLLSQVIPFGIGKRSCVGEGIAKAELYLLFGNLLLRYNVQPHGSLPVLNDFLPFSAGKIPDKSAKLEFIKV